MALDINWCRIESSGLLRFEGLDAQAFLQGQLTSNVLALTAQKSQYSGYCTAKGRLLACMLLWQRDGAYYMMLPRELSEPVRQRLSMYILRTKVKAMDASAEHILFGVTGKNAETTVGAVVVKFGGTAPRADHEAMHQQTLSVLKLPVERYLIVACASAAGEIEAALASAAVASPETLWTRLDIEAGIPSVYAATQEQFVPQTVNSDFIGAVSFDKGCYPGQEIVARTHYLGKPKQRMIRAQIGSDESPQAGDKLYSQAFGNQSSGMIVNAVRVGDGRHDVLAVVQTSTIENSDMHWKSPDGPALEIVALPYIVK